MDELLKVGDWVAITLPKDTAPLRCYVGQIDAMGDRGVRLTLIDWMTGDAQGFDLFVRWENIESALVCTDEHNETLFGDAASKWQGFMCGAGEDE